MKKLLIALLLALPFVSKAQINIVDTFSTDVYHVYNSGTFRMACPKGETYIDVDASNRISIKFQSGAQVTQFSSWSNYRLNGQAFGSSAGAIDSLGTAIGTTVATAEPNLNFANADLNFTEDRVHDLNGFSAIVRETGVHSLQVGADVPAGMLPIPNLKFSGFTGSNAADSLMSLNGSLKGFPGFENVYLPFSAAIVGDPFTTSSGKYISNILGIDGAFEVFQLNTITDNDAGIDIDKSFDGDYYLTDKLDNDKIKWQLGKNGSITHEGAYSNNGYVVYQSGGGDTIPDNTSFYIYDPATTQANATIILPANPIDGQLIYIFGGGTVTTGNVITSFTLDGNGSTVLGNGANQLKVGKAIELHYMNGIWYAIEN